MYVAKRVGAAYKQAIEWAINIKKAEVPEMFKDLFILASDMPVNMITEIEEYAKRLCETLSSAISNAINTGLNNKARNELIYTLTITIPNMSRFNQELERIKNIILMP